MLAAVGLFIVYIIIVVIILWWSYKIDGEKLSNDELDDISDITMNFHKYPNEDDFNYVFAKHKHLLKARRAIKFWLWGVHLSHPNYFDDGKMATLNSYMEDIRRGIRRFKIKPTSELIDCIWALYFATGNMDYANMIRDVAFSNNDASVIRAASWSYKSIIGHEPKKDTEINPFDNGDDEDNTGENRDEISAETNAENNIKTNKEAILTK